MQISKELILCPNCKGWGFKAFEECIDYHKKEYNTIEKTCLRCKGDGRLLKTIQVTLEAYKKKE